MHRHIQGDINKFVAWCIISWILTLKFLWIMYNLYDLWSFQNKGFYFLLFNGILTFMGYLMPKPSSPVTGAVEYTDCTSAEG